MTSLFKNLIKFIEPDTHTREGLSETPERVEKAWKHMVGGYQLSPENIMKTFEDGAEDVDEMVVVDDIPFYSTCEHHLLPIIGVATIGYIPDGKVLGLSKMVRLVDIYARRLQVQERMTVQIASAMQKYLEPVGVGVVIKARHLCIEARGVCQRGTVTTTSALRGAMKDNSDARREFLSLIKNKAVAL